MPILDNKKNIRSFGRINGRGVDENVKNKLNEKLTKYSFDINNIDINGTNYLEIGFGYGESIAERAPQTKSVNYIGCETYTKGVLNLLNLMEQHNVENIRIFNGDARLLLEALPDKVLDKVFILFPDPWPKKKQNKRRIIGDDFLILLSKKIKTGGTLFFASDIDSYVDWSLEKVGNNHSFSLISNTKQEPSWWVKTKYQQKAITEGRQSSFLEWKIID